MPKGIEVELSLKNRLKGAYRTAMDDIRSSSSKAQKSIKTLGAQSRSSFDQIRKSALSTKIAVTALTGYITSRLVKAITTAGSEVEDYTGQFKVLLGSYDAAQQKMRELEKTAQTTPFQLRELAEAQQLMLSFGVEADKTNTYMQQIGDVSLGNAEKFQRLALAFSQTQAAGKLMGQDLLQYINAGFNPLLVISQKTGESMLQLRKRMSDGRISSLEVAEAFKIATSEGGRFHRGLLELSGTATGLTSTIKDQLNAAVRQALAGGIWEKYKNALSAIKDKLNEAIDSGVLASWGRHLSMLASQVGEFVKIGRWIFIVFAASKIKALVMGFGSMVMQFRLLNPTLAAVTATLTAMEAVLYKMGRSAVDAGLGMTDFVKTVEQGERLKSVLQKYKKLQKAVDDNTNQLPRAMSSWNYYGMVLHGTDKNAKALAETQKQLKALTSKAFVDELSVDKAERALRSLNAQIKILQAQPKKVADIMAPSALEQPKMPDITATGMDGRLEAAQRVINDMEVLNRNGATRELERLRQWYNERLVIIGDDVNNRIMLENVYRARKEDILRKDLAASLDMAKAGLKNEAEIARQKKALLQEQVAGSLSAFSSIIGAMRVFGEKNKAIAYTQAVIDTLAAANAAYRSVAAINPILAAAAATAAIIEGMGRARKINEQKFASGGIVAGSGGTDSVAARVTPGEMVLTKQQQLALLNGGVGSTFTIGEINVYGSSDPQATANLVAQTVEEKYQEWANTRDEVSYYQA